MRVFESLVAGLENVGVTAAFGGAGETCTGMMLDAKITRWAIPHFRTSPRGTIAGIIERIEERMRGADKT